MNAAQSAVWRRFQHTLPLRCHSPFPLSFKSCHASRPAWGPPPALSRLRCTWQLLAVSKVARPASHRAGRTCIAAALQVPKHAQRPSAVACNYHKLACAQQYLDMSTASAGRIKPGSTADSEQLFVPSAAGGQDRNAWNSAVQEALDQPELRRQLTLALDAGVVACTAEQCR